MRPHEYRRRAEFCERIAAQQRSEELRLRYERLAGEWRALQAKASEVEADEEAVQERCPAFAKE